MTGNIRNLRKKNTDLQTQEVTLKQCKYRENHNRQINIHTTRNLRQKRKNIEGTRQKRLFTGEQDKKNYFLTQNRKHRKTMR